MRNFLLGASLPVLWGLLVALVIVLLVWCGKRIFSFLPPTKRKKVYTACDIAGQLIKFAMKKGQKKAIFNVIRKSLSDWKLSKEEIYAIIQAIVDYVKNSLDDEAKRKLMVQFGDIEAALKEWVTQDVAAYIAKRLVWSGIKVGGEDAPDDNNQQYIKLKRQVSGYAKKTEGLTDADYHQEVGAVIPIAEDKDIILAAKANQNWGHRIYKLALRLRLGGRKRDGDKIA